ncbi:glycosyltransferase [Phytoactinopolyspora mesophila]|uniref:Glycosyltransferase n=1 Tax=Phytoactinopolyspora mesophila TaxID=2650750 RepID=A0A7K3M039_9ACTN|nr:glycosyltransferase [Phytoactinopolyspora mesophila]NDL56661.1 glycosyltransferase [Phytoactinopolyspora mesophila]
MKVLLLTHGTRGDVEPFVALAEALRLAGHEPIVAAPSTSSQSIEQRGLNAISLYDPWPLLSRERVIREAFERNYRGLLGKWQLIQVVRKYRHSMPSVLEDIAKLGDTYADMLVYHPAFPGNRIAERTGVPSVAACVQPLWVPTDSFTNPLIPYDLPAALNHISYLATRIWFRIHFGGTSGLDKVTRRRLRGGRSNVLRKPDGRPATILQAFSTHMLPSPLNYPSWVHTTGFWFSPATRRFTPPRALSKFLETDKPVVYVGFGSSIGIDPVRQGRIIRQAIRLAGVRAVVVSGWGGIEPESDEDTLPLKNLPFDWLFPRMAAIVHHGGVGTTGSALASGRPQVVCPFYIDQPFLARRMHASGVAPEPLPQIHLTPDRLAIAIRVAVESRRLNRRAKHLGRLVRDENGVAAATRILESECQ